MSKIVCGPDGGLYIFQSWASFQNDAVSRQLLDTLDTETVTRRRVEEV